MQKKLSKRQERKKRQEEMQRKQLKIAWQYPFCRRCKIGLGEAWAKKLEKQGHMPLCEKCLPLMMEQYAKLGELWAKFNRR